MKPEILTPGSRNSFFSGRCAIAVMIKTPRNGISKTRLSPPLLSEEAAEISRCFLRDTSAVIETLMRDDQFAVGVAVYTPVGSEPELAELLPAQFKMLAQRHGDLGSRLSGAAEDLFSLGFSAVCLVDSDSPTLPIENLRAMAATLREAADRMIIGPCTDGGYYLVGMSRLYAKLFEEIDWSTGSVYQQTIRRAKEISLPTVELPVWYDVDDKDSLNRLLSELFPEWSTGMVPQGSPAPNTKEFLLHLLTGESAARVWPLRTPRSPDFAPSSKLREATSDKPTTP
jgi:rSAM/selenodomain-associated transferase 1